MRKYKIRLGVKIYAFALFFCSTAMAAPVEMLRFSVFDADSGSDVPARVTVNNSEIPNGEYWVPIDEESTIYVQVRAHAEHEYYTRGITIFLPGLDRRPIFNIYLAKRSQSSRLYSRGNVFAAAKYIGDKKEGDRAVALLNRIDHEAEETLRTVPIFAIFFNYNLASAYYNSCTMRFVDQCEKSRKLLEQLVSRFDQDRRFFDDDKITLDKLKAPEIDLFNSRYLYQKILWEIQRRRPDEAQTALESLRNDVDADPKLFERLKIRKEYLDDLSRQVEHLREQTVSVGNG
ncbi:MAG: hypothetical protein V9F04_15630 [Dermatophilaceae bacterium]